MGAGRVGGVSESGALQSQNGLKFLKFVSEMGKNRDFLSQVASLSVTILLLQWKQG